MTNKYKNVYVKETSTIGGIYEANGPLKKYLDSIIKLKVNEDYSIKDLAKKLDELGYVKETIVTATGTFATRGFVFDIYPISEENPIRIEYWGD